MTIFSQITNDKYRRGNSKDRQPRPQRQDVGQAFLDAGFTMTDSNKFQVTAFGIVFDISPSHRGLIATAKNVVGYRFDFGTPPKTIADKLKEIACLVLLSWQEEDEYQSAWKRYGLSRQEI